MKPGPVRTLHLLLAATAVTPFVFVPGFLYPSVVPRAIYFRTLVGVGLVLLAWLWARGADRSRSEGWREERVALTLAAFTAAAALSAAAGTAPLQGLMGEMVRMGGVVAWVFYLAFFLLLRAVLDEESWPSFLRLVSVVGGAVALWSFLQAYGAHFGLALVGWETGRVGGTLGLAGPLAAYLLLGTAVSGYLASRADSWPSRIGWGLVAAVQLWGMLLSGTKAVLLGAVAGAVTVCAWGLLRSPSGSRLRRIATWGLAAVAVGAVGIVLWGGQAFPVVNRLMGLGPDALADRLPMWRTAVAGFLEHPLLGVGPENFDVLFDRLFRPSYYVSGARAHQDQAHNVILGAAAETGVVGLVAYLAFLGAVLGAVAAALRRAAREPELLWLAAGVLGYLFYLQLWFEDLASFHLFLVVLAFLEHRRPGAGGDAAREDAAPARGGTETRTPAARPGRRWGTLVLAGLLLVGTGWYHAQVAGASRQTRAALSADSAAGVFGGLQRALSYPLASTLQVTSRYVGALDRMVAGVRQGAVDLDSAEVEGFFAAGERAVAREVATGGGRSLGIGLRGRLRAARFRWRRRPEDLRAAAADFRRALEMSPGRVRYLHALARLHAQAGETARAMEVLERARDRFPGWWETYQTMAQVKWDAGRREEAVDLLRRAAEANDRRPRFGVSEQFVIRAGSWLEARGTPLEAVRLYEAYLGSRFPGWNEPPGRRVAEVPSAALPVAARLPITLLQTGRTEEAAGAARRLLERLPPHLRRPAVTDRLRRFLDDLQAGRTDRWRQEWGVLPTDVPLDG